MTGKLDLKTWVQRSNTAHEGFYDYSSSEYKGMLKKIKLTCPLHGEIEQKAVDHSIGRKPSCCRPPKLNLKTWIDRSNKAHNGFYDYTNSKYNGIKEKITFLCPLHGEIEQFADNHSKGHKPSCCRPPKLNLKTWIDRSNKAHNGFYDYTNSKYNGIKEKITFLCPLHGEIEQGAEPHSIGMKPSCCAVNGKVDFKSWAERSNNTHDGFYDYTNSKYEGMREKITFICPLHGEVEQIAGNHSRGHKPSCCSIRGKVEFNTWKERSNEAHDGFYDYSQSEYHGISKKIKLKCPLHGEVEQYADNHSKGHVPSCCKGSKISNAKAGNREDFIKNAKLLFGDKFDYDNVSYIRSRIPVIIGCPKHGQIKMTPNSHLTSVTGCMQCGIDSRSSKLKFSKNKFIQQAKEIHGEKYDYSRAIYTNANQNIEIICNIHGPFYPTPALHVHQKTGCPDCSELGFRNDKSGSCYVHEIKLKATGEVLFYKMGISNNWKRRMKDLRRTLPSHLLLVNVETIEFEYGKDARKMESFLLSLEKIRSPTVSFPGGTELFSQNPFDYARKKNIFDYLG